MKVPFLDLNAQYKSIQDEVSQAMEAVIAKTAFAGGPFVETFEDEFAAYCECRHAIGVGSGTEALWLTLLALGIGKGDEVITVPNSFIATAEAISFCGATPVFVDVDEDTYTMDPALLEDVISQRTKAVIPVHLFGQPANMGPIIDIARKYSLAVVEDSAQAHGARYKECVAGSLGDAGCFSFYPGKNLGAYGEAGAITTNDGSLADKLRMLRDHGQAGKHMHTLVGWNSRMDGFQAAILSVKLKRLEQWTQQRRHAAATYKEGLYNDVKMVLPLEADYAKHVYHIFAIRSPKRDDLMQYLTDRGIQCAVHYPAPIHRQEAYSHLELSQGTFPVAERCANEYLSLPMYPELSREQVEYVIAHVNEFVRAQEQDVSVPSAREPVYSV